MAKWKVSPEYITLFEHPTADRLEVARVGLFQLVVGKSNNFENGQLVVFIPKRSVLPEWLRDNYKNPETGESYLKNGCIVKSIALKKQLSEGCTLSPEILNEVLKKNEETKEFPQFCGKTIEDLVGVDLSELLGITLYVPPIPLNMAGEVETFDGMDYSEHDVESMTIFTDEFSENEKCLVEEKLHGTQGNYIKTETGEEYLSSKGLISNQMFLKKNENNLYWYVVQKNNLKEIIDKAFPDSFVQVMFEVINTQKSFDYGITDKNLKIYRIEVNGKRYNFMDIANYDEDTKTFVPKSDKFKPIFDLWVPVLGIYEFNMETFMSLAKGTEQVSGNNKHIKEGIVIQPVTPRNTNSGGVPLIVKVINPKYKGEDNDDDYS